MIDSEHLEFENIEMNVNLLPKVDELQFISLERKYIQIMLINNGIVFTSLLIAMVYGWYFDQKGFVKPYFQWILMGYLGIFLLSLFLVYKSFVCKSYAVRQKDITLQTGWLWKKIITIPFNRVQHCEVNQSILDRYYDLAKIKIYTAGGSSSDLRIPGINISQANDLKAYILNQVQEDD